MSVDSVLVFFSRLPISEHEMKFELSVQHITSIPNTATSELHINWLNPEKGLNLKLRDCNNIYQQRPKSHDIF